MRKLIVAALSLGAILFAPAAASAQLQLAADLDAIFPQDDRLGEETGFGINGRLGLGLPLPAVELVPEISVGYVDFARAGPLNPGVVRAMVGARVGFGALLRPTLFAHVGWASLSLDQDDDFFEPPGGLGEEDALAADAGIALDLALLPLLTVGAHGAYNLLDTDDALDWWSAGVHAALSF